MSNVKSDQLFNLIHSLSKGEKRFFKLYASRLTTAGDKKFVMLFDAIEKQKVYNEDKILEKNKQLNPTQFSNLKAHLYYQLLKSTKLCNSSNLENIKITELLDYARILYNKCLYKECVKMIDKAKAMASENDRSVLLLEILELEKLVIPKTLESGNEQRVNLVINTTNYMAESIKNINTFSNLSLRLNSYYVQTGFSKSKEDLQKVTNYFHSSLPDYKEVNLSFQEKMYLYSSFVGYYFYIQDFSNGYKYAAKWVALFEQQPEMKRHKLELYIKALNSLLAVQNKLYKYKEFSETQKQLIAIKRDKNLVLTENINLNLFKAIYVHEINRHFMLGEFKSGTRIVAALENELDKFVPKLDKHSVLLLYYKIACLYVGSGNYRTAIKWLNKIYNEKEIDLRADIYSFTRILLLVCHFELGNDYLVESNIRSTYRYFRKKGELSQYQKYILKFLRDLFSDFSDRNLKKQFVELKKQMVRLESNKYERRAFLYFDIISWLESKIENKSVQEIIKEKARKKIM
ncbi:MAG: hypothetical protein IPP64_02430 [Bacteroidetes bacterium]|nr:hypothetical protein [Bacteroidota bacterium]